MAHIQEKGIWSMFKSSTKILIRNSYLYGLLSSLRGYILWQKRHFAAPSPYFIKKSCLIRNSIPNAIWIETGTYRGQTTQLLSKYATKVYSIEPEENLFNITKYYFNSFKNVEIINGVSENVFPYLLPKINGDVNFWLDGHYSEGITFKGPKDTPIVDELNSIRKNLTHFDKVVIFIDDIRCFNPELSENSEYPPVDFLIRWARENNFYWHIEHDIFIAKN